MKKFRENIGVLFRWLDDFMMKYIDLMYFFFIFCIFNKFGNGKLKFLD